tara:strand:+ start:2412 stop:2804 length:393 start_codon:yes stop_codon:yes gene_type:complete
MNNLDILTRLNNSKYFSGIVMILLNIGSKYVSLELSEAQQQFLSHPIIRKLLVFTIFFVATKDIVVSVILSTIFIIFVCGVFHEDSRLCVFKNVLKSFCEKRKVVINKEDYEKAKKIISKYESQQIKDLK